MIGVEDRFGLSGKPWELVQAMGLTAEHIAERVLNLYAKKRELRPSRLNLETRSAVVECSYCHRAVSFEEYFEEFPPPMDEICADCERASPQACAACCLAWMRANSAFTYRCRECCDIVVPC